MNRYTRIHDFHASRATGVGSSDIATLAGLWRSRKKTTLTLWEEKTGRTPPWDGNERTEIGSDLEAYVLYRFVKEQYGQEVAEKFYFAKLREKSFGPFKAKTECRHPERKYCIAHADLLVDGPALEPHIVEAKVTGYNAGKRREGEIFTGYDPDDLSEQGIPDAVFLQVQWQLYCYGVERAFVVVMIDTGSVRTYGPILANPRVQEKCLALAERFLELVKADTPPEPETWDDVAKLFPADNGTTAMVSGDVEMEVRSMLAEDAELASRIKALNARRDDIENAIGILIGENAVLASADGDVLARRGMSTPRDSIALTDLKKKDGQRYDDLVAAGWIKTGEAKPQVRY